jgi:hypothetical protein
VETAIRPSAALIPAGINYEGGYITAATSDQWHTFTDQGGKNNFFPGCVRHGFGAQEKTIPLPGQLPALLMAGYGQHLDKDAENRLAQTVRTGALNREANRFGMIRDLLIQRQFVFSDREPERTGDTQ